MMFGINTINNKAVNSIVDQNNMMFGMNTINNITVNMMFGMNTINNEAVNSTQLGPIQHDVWNEYKKI